MKTQAINAPDAPPAAGGYAQALQVEGVQRWLFVSGQIPATLEGDVPDGFEAQAALAWRNVMSQLRAAGMAMIVVDKNLGPLMALADQHVVIEKGRVAWHGNTDALRADQATVEQYLGV